MAAIRSAGSLQGEVNMSKRLWITLIFVVAMVLMVVAMALMVVAWILDPQLPLLLLATPVVLWRAASHGPPRFDP